MPEPPRRKPLACVISLMLDLVNLTQHLMNTKREFRHAQAPSDAACCNSWTLLRFKR